MRGPNDALFPSSLNDEEKDSQSKIHHRAMKQKTSLNAAADEFQSKLTNAFGNANKFFLERVVVNDGAKCLSDPSYQPFSLPGVNVRSGCFGSTADAAYSLSEKLVNNLGELSDGNIVADASALTKESQDFIVLVFGENGQVAQSLQKRGGDVDVICLGRDQADLGSPDMLRAAIMATDADVIINAAAYTAVDKAEDDPASRLRVRLRRRLCTRSRVDPEC